jgi:hypothetical protein
MNDPTPRRTLSEINDQREPAPIAMPTGVKDLDQPFRQLPGKGHSKNTTFHTAKEKHRDTIDRMTT